MAKYIRRSDDGEVRVLSEEERNAEDEISAQGAVALASAAVCTLTYLATVGIETPMAKTGAIAVALLSLALGAALYKYILGLVSLVFIAGICFAAYSWVTSEDPAPEKSKSSIALETAQALEGTVTFPEISRTAVSELPAIQENEISSPSEQVDTFDSSNSGATRQFIHAATLVDSRGKIVLQSEPRMTSKNVTTLPSGSAVLAKSKDGKWIEIRTSDGQTGFVRFRQLNFDSE